MIAATIPSFTKEEILTVLKAVVQEAPDTVYKAPWYMDPERTGRCFYVHVDKSGVPTGAGCVVGQVLHRLGVPLDDLRQAEKLSASGALKLLGQDGASPLAEQLQRVQFLQDHGETWEAAYMAVFGELW